jgi:hypothetical protein
VRKDMVLARINAPLPQELCQRKVSTSWVSPAVTRLYGDDGDRNVMRKSPSESFQLGMASPKLIARPASAPTKVSKPLDVSQRSTQGASMRRNQGKEETGSTILSCSAGTRGGTIAAQQSPLALSADTTHGGAPRQRGTLLSRVPSASNTGLGEQVAETMSLEVKPISTAAATQRLELMSQQFQKQTFGEYMKDYDIFTGDKKTRLNEKRLFEEERGYVSEMEKMVGGRALAVNPFSKAQIRRMVQVAAGTGPPKVLEAHRLSSKASLFPPADAVPALVMASGQS